MDNKYKLLESFLINAIKDLSFSWSHDINSQPFSVKFTNLTTRTKNQTEYINIIFESQKLNELIVKLKSVKDDKTQVEMLIIPMDKVPDLMEHLTVTEYSFQINTRVEIKEDEFNKVNKHLNTILNKGKLNGKIATIDSNNTFSIEIGKQKKLLVEINNINTNYLGLQVLSVKLIKNEERLYPLSYQRFIPLHKIDQMPFLSSIVKVPIIEKNSFTPDIDGFISGVIDMNCKHLSPIALSMQLQGELVAQDVKKKINKI